VKRVALAIVGTITGLVMFLSFKTHALGSTVNPPAAVSSANAGAAAGSSAGRNSSGGSGASRSGGSTSKQPSSGSSGSSSATSTVTGDTAQTLYGPIEVRITVKDGKVTAASAVEYPSQDPRDAQINYYAIPILNREAVQADSANIAHVSGATYTSNGYMQSLQSALNRAGL
jgi:uncharacterized protein with FMN-binding domain